LIRLSKLLEENPSIDDFWSLERCVSATARKFSETDTVDLLFDIEPEYRTTPRKWEMILTAAYERGLRARKSSHSF